MLYLVIKNYPIGKHVIILYIFIVTSIFKTINPILYPFPLL